MGFSGFTVDDYLIIDQEFTSDIKACVPSFDWPNKLTKADRKNWRCVSLDSWSIRNRLGTPTAIALRNVYCAGHERHVIGIGRSGCAA